MNARHQVQPLKVALIYFSATNVTRTYAGVIGDELQQLGCNVQSIDVTPWSVRHGGSALSMGEFDAFVFGFPVFADFAPRVINEWLPTLDGMGKRCAAFFTYGGRTTGYAPFHTALLLEQAGFRVQCAAELLGRHTYNLAGWNAVPDRPNDVDFAVARQFAALACERFTAPEPTPFMLQKPFAYEAGLKDRQSQPLPTQRRPRQPVRRTLTCSMCGLCESECPDRAFDAEAGLSDPQRCLECLHCVYICPDQVLAIEDQRSYWPTFLQRWHVTEEMMAAKQSKVIAEPWQAAS